MIDDIITIFIEILREAFIFPIVILLLGAILGVAYTFGDVAVLNQTTYTAINILISSPGTLISIVLVIIGILLVSVATYK